MENDCEIYVDPEEDEVFFGCISEKEKSLCAKLEANAENDNENEAVESLELNVDERNNKNILMNDQSGIVQKKIIISDLSDLIAINQHGNSVEMEHNYSTPIKPKIDKSILTTPKTIVKADKDGGFLKVLSEIALVKAEAEGDKTMSKSEEDKENRIIQNIPEIKVTEATPEKTVLSPPVTSNKQTNPFRIIYRSPNENKSDQKSHSDSEKDVKSGFNKNLTNKRKSVDLIDLEDVYNLNDNMQKENIQKNEKRFENDKECDFFTLKDTKNSVCEELKDVQIIIPDVESPIKIETPVPKPAGLRFSKEARKIVEVLKKSSCDDSLNFRIEEDEENNDTSFVLPEPSDFDKTEFLFEEAEKPEPKLNKFLSKTVEKDFHKVLSILPRSKVETVKHVSERKVYQQVDSSNNIKKCVKKLPLEEHRSTSVERDIVSSSKIPLSGVKNTEIPLINRIPKPVSTKTTTAKTPTTKTIPKNSKFNHISSPINAYIHNKPTVLVVNVKSEQKKNPTTGIPTLQTTGSVKKPTQTKSLTRTIPAPEKSSKLQSSSTIRLPFVEYKSGTPYKIDKIPESRLPRLAPSVQKLLGTQSPRVLKHEGRFYLTTPKKTGTAENSTIIADPNEVSVVLCQSAQKSNTIK